MKLKNTYLLLATSLGLILVGIGVVHVTSKAPTEDEWVEILTSSIARIVPHGARSCGIVILGQDANNAETCMQTAKRNNAIAWTASEAQGIDSRVWLLIVQDSEKLRAFNLDSYGWEQRGTPSFTMHSTACSKIARGSVIKDVNVTYLESALICGK